MDKHSAPPSKAGLGPEWIKEDYITDFYTFLSTVKWSEWWLVALIIFHISCFLIIILTRQFQQFQFGLFFSLLSIVYFAERINALGAEHWRLFSSEQYFDSAGLFISTVLSMPVLVNCTILIISWLHSAGKMLIRYKRAELKEKAKRKTEEVAEAETKKSN